MLRIYHVHVTYVLFQLARIQTDSVAETLKELYPELQLEIGIEISVFLFSVSLFFFLNYLMIFFFSVSCLFSLLLFSYFLYCFLGNFFLSFFPLCFLNLFSYFLVFHFWYFLLFPIFLCFFCQFLLACFLDCFSLTSFSTLSCYPLLFCFSSITSFCFIISCPSSPSWFQSLSVDLLVFLSLSCPFLSSQTPLQTVEWLCCSEPV